MHTCEDGILVAFHRHTTSLCKQCYIKVLLIEFIKLTGAQVIILRNSSEISHVFNSFSYSNSFYIALQNLHCVPEVTAAGAGKGMYVGQAPIKTDAFLSFLYNSLSTQHFI